jgi:hypothetical protein
VLPSLLCQRSVDYVDTGLFLNSHFVPLMCLPLYRDHTLDYCNFIVCLDVKWCSPSSSFFSFDCSLFWVFSLRTQILESICQYPQKSCWNFYLDYIEHLDKVGKNCLLDSIESSFP